MVVAQSRLSSTQQPVCMFVTHYPPFRSYPLLGNPHLQTVLPFFRRARPGGNPTQCHVVHTADNDVLVIHDNTPKKWIVGDRIVVLLHGLCGSHRSNYMRRTAEKLRRNACRTIRIDMRGQGDAKYLSRGHAHAAATGDLASVIQAVQQLSPLSYITLVGFSLGANIVLRLCGEWKDQPPEQVDSVIAVSPPVDLTFCSGNLRQWGNRLYDWYFCSQISHAISDRRQRVPNLIDNGLIRFPSRLVHLDDQFIAPVNGFRGARDYYQAASSGPVLRDISLATLIVASEDDPIVPVSMYDHWVRSADIEFVKVKRGGHLGFLSSTPGDPDRHWLEWRIVRMGQRF
ncbi:MAG: alpha/beta fold hydrolase [Pirellulaceae bacterium]